MNKVKVGIIGATGYAGVELLRLLLNHKNVEVCAISSISFEGQKISEVYSSLYNICDEILTNEDEVIEKSDVIFASLPHGICEALAKKCVDKNKYFIDLGADFRFENEEDYKQWYSLEYKHPELHEISCYCIPELHRDNISDAKIIGNPGCYPTSIGLGLAPALKAGIAKLETVIIDAKSGVTGAGRGLAQNTHYPDCNEAFSPYKVANHRHTPEIEKTLKALSGEEVKITFVPHLLPVNRGIVSTIYVSLSKEISIEEINTIYSDFYKNEKFVRVLKNGNVANLRDVKYSNYCDISVHKDERTNRLIVVSTIDNMVKGAAGQAIQNMNLLMGLDERDGLDIIPPSF